MGYVLRSNTTWGPMYYSDSIEGTVDKKKAAVFDSEDEARKFLKTFDWLILKDIKHDKVEIVKEECKMKGLKEFVKAKKISESVEQKVVIHTKNGKVSSIEQGTYMPNGIFIGNAGASFDKGFIGMDPEDAKAALVKFSRYDPKNIIVEGCKRKIQEAKTNDRIFPDTAEVQVVSKTGAFGIQVFIDTRERSGTPDGKRKIHWNISTVYEGPYNSEANKNLYVDENENLEKLVKAHADEFKAVIKRGIERIDDEIASTLKKLGYK